VDNPKPRPAGLLTFLAVLAAGALAFFLVIRGQDDGRAANASRTAPRATPAFAAFQHAVQEDCRRANRAIDDVPRPRNPRQGRAYLLRTMGILMLESDGFARRPAPREHHREIAKLQALNRRDVRLLGSLRERLRTSPGRRELMSVFLDLDRARATLGPEEEALARSLGLGVCVS
jgi:hypothetical protein